jgi:hypothetical protein
MGRKNNRVEVQAAPPQIVKDGRSFMNSRIPRCGHPKRGGKGPCRAVMMKNGMGCQIHGGRTPVGLDNPNTSDTPRYVTALKGTKLIDRYEKAKQDATLLELHEEIALVQAFIEDLLSRFDDGEGRITIKTILKCYEEMIDAGLNKKWAIYNKKMDDLVDLLHGADRQFALVEDIKSQIKLKKDLVESQSKREIQLEQMMKAEDVMLLIKVVLGEVRGVIYDRLDDKSVATDILNEVSEKVAGHLGRGNSRGNRAALSEG